MFGRTSPRLAIDTTLPPTEQPIITGIYLNLLNIRIQRIKNKSSLFAEQTPPVVDLTTETPLVTELVDVDTIATTESELETTFFSRPSPRLITLTSTVAPETTTVVIDFTAGDEERVPTTPVVETETTTEGETCSKLVQRCKTKVDFITYKKLVQGFSQFGF